MAKNKYRFLKETEWAIVEQLAYEYKLHLSYIDPILYGDDCDGIFLAPNTIAISKACKFPLETFFHELGHFYCYKNNIFPAYHSLGRKYSKQAVCSTAWRAENWVDKWAEKKCREYFPDYKWEGTFRTKSSSKWLQKYLKEYYSIYYN